MMEIVMEIVSVCMLRLTCVECGAAVLVNSLYGSALLNDEGDDRSEPPQGRLRARWNRARLGERGSRAWLGERGSEARRRVRRREADRVCMLYY